MSAQTMTILDQHYDEACLTIPAKRDGTLDMAEDRAMFYRGRRRVGYDGDWDQAIEDMVEGD